MGETKKSIDFLSALVKDGFVLDEVENQLGDEWVDVEYVLKDPASLGFVLNDDMSDAVIKTTFRAKRGLDAEKKDEHTLISNVMIYIDDEPVMSSEQATGRSAEALAAGVPEVKRQKQADLGPIRQDEVVEHPYRKFPRNWPCFCGSGMKFKKCHINQVPSHCLKNEYPKIKKSLDDFIAHFEGRKDAIIETQRRLGEAGELN